MVSRLQYAEHFLDCVDSVENGRNGSISDDRRLISEYDPSFYAILAPHLNNSNPRVRKETVLLLSKLRERRAMDRVKEMRVSDNDNVIGACLAYLSSVDVDDNAASDLIEELRHTNGKDFLRAAYKLRQIAREQDVDRLREIYGSTDGEMRAAIRDVLSSVVDRTSELRERRYLIMSEPVYPDEEGFLRFMDKSTVYLDIRYRDNIASRDGVDLKTYNNIASALRKIQIRLYNEKSNLVYYGSEAKEAYKVTEGLLLWAFDDLRTKEVTRNGNDRSSLPCPHCGKGMIHLPACWECPGCGYRI